MGAYCSYVNICNSDTLKRSSSSQRGDRNLKLLLIGLDNAGKTSTVMHLLGRPLDDVVPTVGFSNHEMKQFNKFKVEIYDLGGGEKIRGIWKNYFALVHGIIYVIDSSDEIRISEVKENLEEVIQHDKISQKPILILINKQDVEGALDEVDILKNLNIESLVNKYKCPTRIESCSASAHHVNQDHNDDLELSGKSGTDVVHHHNSSRSITSSKKEDSGIDRGYFWLIRYIIKNWNDLKARVDVETAEQTEIERNLMRERFLKFQKSREDEEEKNDNDHNELSDHQINGNPFMPIQEVIEKSSVPAAGAAATSSSDQTVSSPKKGKKMRRFTKKIPMFKSNKVIPHVTPHKCH